MSVSRLLPLLLLAACAGPASQEGTTAGAPATTNQLAAGEHDVHALLTWLAGSPASDEGDLLTLPLQLAPFRFDEVVPSWNVELPAGAGFRAEMRVLDLRGDATSAWYDLGTWGEAPRGEPGPARDGLGVVDVDVFRSERLFDAVELRFHLHPTPDGDPPRVQRATLCLSNTTGDAEAAVRGASPAGAPDPALWQRRLDVPFRSQRTEDPAIAGRICSPTSVSMVLAWYGIERPTAEVAARAYDAEHDIYGGWARAVQAAYEEGLPGYVTRFARLEDLRPHIAAGRPVIVSVRAREGELAGAPYASTGGHLIVVTGFDERGDVHVNDPATADPARGVVTYRREDMERVWLGRGGVAYVLLPPGG